MENHNSSTKPRPNLCLETPSAGNVATFYSIAADPYTGTTDSALQTMVNSSGHSFSELSNSSFDVVMEQSKSISACSIVAHSDTGNFVESVDSCRTTVTSSSVPPVENREALTYHHMSTQGQVRYNSMESFKRSETESSQFWALIEWETSDEEPNSYTVINSSQIIEIARETSPAEEEYKQRTKDSGLYTGKLIHVLRGRYVMPATIVIISEDRKFLETELHQLRIMAANNLITKSAISAQTYRRQTVATHKQYGRQLQYGAKQVQQKTTPPAIPCVEPPENIHSVKRQRCDSGSSTSTIKESESRVSSASAPKPAKEEAYVGIPFNADNSQHTPPARTIAPRFTRNEHAHAQAPPMTFDQQTQTTGTSAEVAISNAANLKRMMSYLESIMAEQKGYRMESEYNRKLFLELQEKVVEQHEMLRNVQAQVAKLEPADPPTRLDLQSKETSSGNVVVADVLQKYSPTITTNAMIVDTYETTTNNNNHIVLESREHSTNQSWTSSKMDMLCTRKSITASDVDNSSRIISESTIYIEKLDNPTAADESAQRTTNCSAEVHDWIANDWNDSLPEGESNDHQRQDDSKVPQTTMVAIGRNNTMVSKSVLDNIKWVSYKFATRKLLQAVFPRDVLATHSLSGKPCPTQINSTGKPVKQALDPNIVADVVELIVKKFRVDESNVRAVITNKCADENKMRQKKKVTPAPSNGVKREDSQAKQLCDKENQQH